MCSLHPQEVEPCIGCMQVPAGTKLVRLCQTAGKSVRVCGLCITHNGGIGFSFVDKEQVSYIKQIHFNVKVF